jgi:sterol desaturase/sphingolipid hydroxylase (fatty acid hydroxylase superfamily)
MNAPTTGPVSTVEVLGTRPRTGILSYLVFPAVMTGCVAIAATMLASGIAPKYVNPAIVPPLFVLMTLLERLHPYRPEWNESRGDLRVDVCYFFVTSFTVMLTTVTLGYVLIPLGGRLAEHAPFLVWPKQLPLGLQVLLALLLAEFGHYWVHRLEHETPLLWRVHAVHHSAPRLYWLNASRFHPIDMMLSGIAGFGPLILFGCPERVLALFTLIGTIHNVFQHANVDVKLGPLNYVFSMAELHRWHHSRNVHEANANYGGHLIWWDVLFGTRFLPKDRLPPGDIGLADFPDYPTTLLKQLASPFVFNRLRKPKVLKTAVD